MPSPLALSLAALLWAMPLPADFPGPLSGIARARPPARGQARYAVAYPRFDLFDLDAPLYAAASSQERVIGYVRRGQAVAVRSSRRGPGCRRGRWWSVAGGGYLCSRGDYRVTRRPAALRGDQKPPARNQALPYDYVRVIDDRAPLLKALPSAADALTIKRAMSGQGSWPDVVHHRMLGDYFLALQGTAQRKGWRYYRTVQGFYVRQKDVKRLSGSKLRGERLSSADALPLVFVHLERVRRYRMDGRKPLHAGYWKRYSRFPLDRRIRYRGHHYLVARTGMAVRREVVRVARLQKRPRKVGRSARWIHIDLQEQTLVAYQGDRPVFATLVSTGKTGHATPAGLHRVHAKYVSTTMSGTDDKSGRYRVEEVPWTLYYDGSYAVHGAYWHDTFGKVRSHGCTNVAPLDAHWLFGWTTPKVPAGWHARLGAAGTWVYLTR
jgi:hypothetical protein